MILSSPSRRPARLRLVAAALVACATALLSGCSGSLIADHMPAAVGGLPEDGPERPGTQAGYPAVPNKPPALHTTPPTRASPPLNNPQQKQLEDDLVSARIRYCGSPDAPSATGTTAN